MLLVHWKAPKSPENPEKAPVKSHVRRQIGDPVHLKFEHLTLYPIDTSISSSFKREMRTQWMRRKKRMKEKVTRITEKVKRMTRKDE